MQIQQARKVLQQASSIAVLTGAGVSAESGIPTFRSNGGYWQTHRFEDLATLEGFVRNPKLVWEFYEERRRAMAAAKPNDGHLALVELEKRVRTFTLVTQNIDGLHDAAGSRNVLKMHGDIWIVRCLDCGKEREDRTKLEVLPPMCGCGGPVFGGMLRPAVVWFGEMLPEGAIKRATGAVARADVFLVVGTSARVFPAAGLIPIALAASVKVIEINPETTDFSSEVDFMLKGPSAEILPALL